MDYWRGKVTPETFSGPQVLVSVENLSIELEVADTIVIVSGSVLETGTLLHTKVNIYPERIKKRF